MVPLRKKYYSMVLQSPVEELNKQTTNLLSAMKQPKSLPKPCSCRAMRDAVRPVKAQLYKPGP